MSPRLPIAAAALAVALATAPSASAADPPVAKRLRGAGSFAFAIGSGDLDGDVTTRLGGRLSPDGRRRRGGPPLAGAGAPPDARRYTRVPAADTAAAQGTLRRFRGRGLLVTTSDYTRRGDGSSETAAVRNSCAAGALPFVTNIGLTRIAPRAFACPRRSSRDLR